MVPFHEDSVLQKLFVILLQGRFLSLLPFIYLFNHFFYISIDSWTFYTVNYNAVIGAVQAHSH